MSTAQAVTQPAYAGELVELNKIEQALAELRRRHGTVPDMTTKDGYQQGKAAIKELTGYRTAADKKRLEITAPHREFINEVNEYGKGLVEQLKAIEDPIKAAKKAVDEAEQREKEKRIADLRHRIEVEILSFKDTAAGQDVAGLEDLLAAARAIDTRGYYDVTAEAEQAQGEVIEFLARELDTARERERLAREQADLDAERARLRAAEEEIERMKAQMAQQAPQEPAQETALDVMADEEMSAWDEAFEDLLAAGLDTADVLTAMNTITAGKVRHITFTGQ